MLSDPVSHLLAAGLRYAALRQRLIADNLANADTPGVRARDLTFEDALDLAGRVRAVPVADGGLAPLRLRLVDSPDPVARPDGNTVDLDRQMARLAATTIYQHTLVSLLAGRINLLRAAIRERA
jgi:flagellar basal-body rod protein FlgB